MASITPKFLDWLKMNMSCKRFARHVATGIAPLEGGFTARFHFWLHWAICPFCRRYWEEIRAMGEIQKRLVDLRHHPAVKIPEIQRRLKEKLIRKTS